MKIYNCKLCNIVFDTFQAKASHVRWQHRDNSLAIEKLRVPRVKRITKSFPCKKCGVLFEITMKENDKKHKTHCSRACANSRGPRTDEFKKNVALKLAGGKTMLKEQKRIECLWCEKAIYTRVKKKKFCDSVCSKKFHSAVIRSKKQDYIKYKHFTAFKFNLKNYPDEFDFQLIESHGWYKAKNRGDNLNGISRDHIISVAAGFKNMINPLILAHPANCQLLRHNDNVSKGKKSGLNIDELLDIIKAWNKKHNENFSVDKKYIDMEYIAKMNFNKH